MAGAQNPPATKKSVNHYINLRGANEELFISS
ncbi:MAG: hypothetical protein JG769_978 [Oscillospiraceae bacterium]|jgi:hypothetical protein|nr:hypothetical protein [Oscillospiraceae bacterium]